MPFSNGVVRHAQACVLGVRRSSAELRREADDLHRQVVVSTTEIIITEKAPKAQVHGMIIFVTERTQRSKLALA
ncbi:hypothetical protein [uncultured Leifsonia sp.]|uniref:hypothetical protein n=1 Tax=uncultured Leifsonia sp. TaxID=340359 RepID=UPI0025E48697|nr:hypothetical protein [uncultured Leifsonia sp.]